MKPKASTLSERFGFQDGELSTPKHDEIMMWLNANAERLFGDTGAWTAGVIAEQRKTAAVEMRDKRLNRQRSEQNKSWASWEESPLPPLEYLPDPLQAEPPARLVSVVRKWEMPIVA